MNFGLEEVTGSERPEIPVALSRLYEGYPGMSEAMGSACAEAASFCFAYHGHPEVFSLRVDGDQLLSILFERGNVDGQMARAWNDHQVATEWGAYGVAALLVEKLLGLCVVERSRKGTGFDFWLGRPDDVPLFQAKARLEVSGIFTGTDREIAARVNSKMRQISRSDGALPAFVVVVEFSQPLSRVVRYAGSGQFAS